MASDDLTTWLRANGLTLEESADPVSLRPCRNWRRYPDANMILTLPAHTVDKALGGDKEYDAYVRRVVSEWTQRFPLHGGPT